MHPKFLPEWLLLGLLACSPGCASAPSARLAIAQPRPPPPPAPPLQPVPPPPVYRNPRIGQVYLRAHQDAAGRLFGPQIMYQVTEPGGWNLEALDSGPGAVPPSPPGPAPDSPLLDPAQAAAFELTGLMRPEDRPAAEARARADQVAVFDPEAGWLLKKR